MSREKVEQLENLLDWLQKLFAFGPILKYKGRSSFTIIAVDSDGEIYYSVCSMRAKNCVDPIGPMSLEGMDAKKKSFYFSSSDVISIDHPNNYLSVFAFCSEQGDLFHAVFCQTGPLEKLFESGECVFSLKIVNSLQMESWQLNNLKVSLQHNPNVLGEYFVITSTKVYLMNPVWIERPNDQKLPWISRSLTPSLNSCRKTLNTA